MTHAMWTLNVGVRLLVSHDVTGMVYMTNMSLPNEQRRVARFDNEDDLLFHIAMQGRSVVTQEPIER